MAANAGHRAQAAAATAWSLLQVHHLRSSSHRCLALPWGLRSRTIIPLVAQPRHGRRSYALPAVAAAASTFTANPSAPPPLPLSESLQWVSRTHSCGLLGEENVGERVRLCGWVASQRNHGAFAFVNLRDHTGVVQVSRTCSLLSVWSERRPKRQTNINFINFLCCARCQVKTDPDKFPDVHAAAGRVRIEYVIAVEGIVYRRPDDVVNKRMATGAVEVGAQPDCLGTWSSICYFLGCIQTALSQHGSMHQSMEVAGCS